jgi:5-methylcytosine-specific restriction protein B
VGAAARAQRVGEIWSWSGTSLPEGVVALSPEVLEGIGHAGTADNTHRWRELSFLIALVREWIEPPPEMQAQQRKDHEAFCAFLDKVPSVDGRQLRQILPHLLFPDHYERISSPRHKREILEGFDVATRKAGPRCGRCDRRAGTSAGDPSNRRSEFSAPARGINIVF